MWLRGDFEADAECWGARPGEPPHSIWAAVQRELGDEAVAYAADR
jgi:hypothetical protein